MLKGKKNSGKRTVKRKKPRLFAGAVISAGSGIQGTQATGQKNYAYGYDNPNSEEDQAQNALAGIPIIGGLTSSIMGVSSGIRGDKTSMTDNFLANIVSPSQSLTATKDAGGSTWDAILGNLLPGYGAQLQKEGGQKAQARIALQKQAAVDKGLIANSGSMPQFAAKGGSLKGRLGLISGGSLNKISPNAVQVQANTPGATDSVELDQAFVDNGEVISQPISGGNPRVFSEDRKAPTGRSFAKEASRLERMKSGSRFAPANERIEGKLDDLFNFQESTKINKTAMVSPKPTLATGGWGDQYLSDLVLDSVSPNVYGQPTRQQLWGNQTPPRYVNLGQYANRQPTSSLGALGSVRAPGVGMQSTGTLSNYTFNTNALSGPTTASMGARNVQPINNPRPSIPTGKQGGVPWGEIGMMAATAAPNIANALLQKRLKGPASPMLEQDVRLERLSADAQLNASNRAYNQASRALTTNTAGGANLGAGINSLFAKRLAAQNETYGVLNNANAQIANQEAGMNQAGRGRNTNRTNAYNQDTNDFYNKKQMMTSENIANLSGKIQARGAEKNQAVRDQLALRYLLASYGDSDVMRRYYEKNPDVAKGTLGNKTGTKDGGTIRTKKNLLGKNKKKR